MYQYTYDTQHIVSTYLFFFNDTATTEIYTLSPTRRSSDLMTAMRLARPIATKPRFISLLKRMPMGWISSERTPAISKDRKSTRLNSSHSQISYAVFCLKKKKTNHQTPYTTKRFPSTPLYC